MCVHEGYNVIFWKVGKFDFLHRSTHNFTKLTGGERIKKYTLLHCLPSSTAQLDKLALYSLLTPAVSVSHVIHGSLSRANHLLAVASYI